MILAISGAILPCLHSETASTNSHHRETLAVKKFKKCSVSVYFNIICVSGTHCHLLGSKAQGNYQIIYPVRFVINEGPNLLTLSFLQLPYSCDSIVAHFCYSTTPSITLPFSSSHVHWLKTGPIQLQRLYVPQLQSDHACAIGQVTRKWYIVFDSALYTGQIASISTFLYLSWILVSKQPDVARPTYKIFIL